MTLSSCVGSAGFSLRRSAFINDAKDSTIRTDGTARGSADARRLKVRSFRYHAITNPITRHENPRSAPEVPNAFMRHDEQASATVDPATPIPRPNAKIAACHISALAKLPAVAGR